MNAFDKLNDLMDELDFQPSPKFVSLPQERMKEIRENSPEHQVHILAADIGYNDLLKHDEVRALLWTKGGLAMAYMSFDFFTPQEGSSSPMPDFDKMSLDEYGHSLVLGEYEASAPSLLDQD